MSKKNYRDDMRVWYERQKYEQPTFKGLYCDECGRLIAPEESSFEIKYNDILCEKCYDKLKGE